MAEAIGLGASVVAFIGIAGQVAQGCQYIRGVLDDVKDAPADLRSLCTETKLFELTLQSLRSVLIDFGDLGTAINGDHTKAVELALEYSKETIAKLIELITTNNGFGGKWKRIQFAIAKDKCAKNVARVERAKGYVLAAQASILLSLEHQQISNTRATNRSLGALTSTLDATSSTISILPFRFDEASIATKTTQQAVSELKTDFSQRLHDLSTGVNAILTSNFTAFTSIISETRARVDEVQHSVRQTQEAVEGMKATSEGLKWLPLGMSQKVKDTFRGVLVEFFYESGQPLHSQETKQREFVRRLALPSHQQSTRRIIHQYTHTRKYVRAIGIITVQSTTTTFRERVDHENTALSLPITSTITQTNLVLNPNPELLRIGVYGSFVQEGFATVDSPPEPKLRVFNVVDTDAQIVKACTVGELTTVRELFATGLASPYDRIWGDRSLLDLVLLQVLSTISSQFLSARSCQRLSTLRAIYEELVRHGLDPGAPRKNDDAHGPSPLSALANLPIHSCNAWPDIVDLGRIIIKNSTHDPTVDAEFQRSIWFEAVSGVENPILTLLRSQEYWDVRWPDTEALVNKVCAQIRERIYQSSLNIETEYSSGLLSKTGPLGDVLLHENGRFILGSILRDCEGILPKFSLTLILLHTYAKEDVQLDETSRRNLLSRFEDRLRECMRSCSESDLDFDQPPMEFHYILKQIRLLGYVDLVSSALLAIGLDSERVHDLFEAELYASMTYQLSHLVRPSETTSYHHSWLPPQLRYHDSPRIAEWRRFCDATDATTPSSQDPSPVAKSPSSKARQRNGGELTDDDEPRSSTTIESSSTDNDISDQEMIDSVYTDDERLLFDDDDLDEDMLDSNSSQPSDDLNSHVAGTTDGPPRPLKRKGLRSFASQSIVSSSEATIGFAIDESQSPTKRICLMSSAREGVEIEEDSDDASSILSNLLAEFDNECQKRDHFSNSSIGQVSELRSASDINEQKFQNMAQASSPEDNLEDDESCDERLRGITIALNAFWT